MIRIWGLLAAVAILAGGCAPAPAHHHNYRAVKADVAKLKATQEACRNVRFPLDTDWRRYKYRKCTGRAT